MRRQGSFPAGTPGNGVPKVILTVGTAFPGTQCSLERNSPLVIRYTFVNTLRFRPNSQFAMLSQSKPALDELYKKDSVCTKIRLYKIQNRKFFRPRAQTLPLVWKGTPLPAPHSFGAQTRRSQSSFSRKRSLDVGLSIYRPTLCLKKACDAIYLSIIRILIARL